MKIAIKRAQSQACLHSAEREQFGALLKRKDYKKPTMKVVELQYRTMLLQASPNENVTPKSSIDDWQDGGTTNDEITM